MKKERGSGVGMVLFVVVVLGIVAFLVRKEAGSSNPGPLGDTERYRSILAFNNTVQLGLGDSGDPQPILDSFRGSITQDGCIELLQFDQGSGEHIVTHSSGGGCATTPLVGRDPSKMYARLSLGGDAVGEIEANLDAPSVQGNYAPPGAGFNQGNAQIPLPPDL